MENKCDFFETKMNSYGISALPKNPVTTMAYVPYQTSHNLEFYSPEQGMHMGTMFPELNKPFEVVNQNRINNMSNDDNTCVFCGGAKND